MGSEVSCGVPHNILTLKSITESVDPLSLAVQEHRRYQHYKWQCDDKRVVMLGKLSTM